MNIRQAAGTETAGTAETGSDGHPDRIDRLRVPSPGRRDDATHRTHSIRRIHPSRHRREGPRNIRIPAALHDRKQTMTDYDRIVENGMERKPKRPNYTLRRVIFAIASIGLIASLTIMLTWHGGSMTAAFIVEGVYIATALWMIIRFAPRDDEKEDEHA